MRKLLGILLSTALFITCAVFPVTHLKASSVVYKDSVLHINEIMASNDSTLRDGDILDKDDGDKGGAYCDWIEIYNKSGQAVDLTGYKISDSKATWIFPKVIIPSKGYLIVWASDKDKIATDGQLHTNFKLSSSGETITLLNADGEICDLLQYPSLLEDESYGSKIDGSSQYVKFSKATPGKVNSEGIEILQPPVFSKEGGLYTQSFELTLSTSESVSNQKDGMLTDNEIYYTLDGSDPVPGASGTMKYTESLQIRSREGEADVISLIETADNWKEPKGEVFKGWTVKAISVNSQGVKSNIVTNSYFVDPDIFNRYKLPIISIVTDKTYFFDSEKGIYLKTKKEDDEKQVPIHIEAYGKDGTLWFSQNSGAKLHGQSSRRYPQKSLRIYASDDYDEQDEFEYEIFPGLEDVEGKRIKSFKRLLLRNSGNDWGRSMIRDGLMQSVVSHLNVNTQHYKPAVMFLNGEFWGIHNIRERYDNHYFSSHYDVDKDKIAMLSWKLSSKETIEIDEGTEEDKDAYLKDITEYLKSNSITDRSVYENIKTKMDIDNFIDYQLSHIYFTDTDWPGNNVVVWKYKTDDGKYHPDAPPGQDGRWRWIIKDMDLGFARLWGPAHDTLSYAIEPIDKSKDAEKGIRSGRNFEWAVFLFRTLLQNDEFRNRFINRFADNINTTFNPVRVNQMVDEIKVEIKKAMPEHIDRWQGISNWESEIGRIKAFAQERPENMRIFIVDEFREDGVTGTSKINLNCDNTKGYIKINSIDIKESTPGIINPDSWTGTYFKGVPISLKAIPEKGYRFDHWIGGGINGKSSGSVSFYPSEDMSITAVFIKEGDASRILKGDLNMNNFVDSIDFAIMRSYMIGKNELTDESMKVADLNIDGFTDHSDFVLMRQYLLGIIKSLPT